LEITDTPAACLQSILAIAIGYHMLIQPSYRNIVVEFREKMHKTVFVFYKSHHSGSDKQGYAY